MTQPPLPESPSQPPAEPGERPPAPASEPPRTDGPAPAPTPATRRMPARGRPDFMPYVTYMLIGVTVLFFAGQNLGPLLAGVDLLTVLGVKSNSAIAQGQWWRLLTPVLLHASLSHILFNMYALYLFGPGLERNYGRARFLALYLISGFAGNVLSLIFSTANSLGASTAVFGLLGAQGVFVYRNRALFEDYRRSLNPILLIAAINLVFGLNPAIDNWGHFGGLLGGSLFAWLGGPLFQVVPLPLERVSVKDVSHTSDSIRAFVSVGLFFGLLALVTILFRIS